MFHCIWVSHLYSSVHGHVRCFHVLPIVNSATMNTELDVSFGAMFLSVYMPRRGITGAYGSSIFSFLRSLHTVLYSGYEVKWKSLSHVRLFVTPQTIQYMEFSRPEYWSGWPFPSPGDLPNPGIETQVSRIAVGFFTSWTTGKPIVAVPIYISTSILFTLSPAFIVCRFFDDGLLFYFFQCGKVQKFQMYKRLKILQWTLRYPLPVSCDWHFACMYLSHFSPSLEGKVSIMDFISFTVLVPFRFSILSVKFCFSNNWYISKFISVFQLIGIKLLIISSLHGLQDLQWCLVFIPDNGDFSEFINFISLFKEHVTLMIILYCNFISFFLLLFLLSLGYFFLESFLRYVVHWFWAFLLF